MIGQNLGFVNNYRETSTCGEKKLKKKSKKDPDRSRFLESEGGERLELTDFLLRIQAEEKGGEKYARGGLGVFSLHYLKERKWRNRLRHGKGRGAIPYQEKIGAFL